MKVLYADSVDESRLQPLLDAGHEVSLQPGLTADDLPAAIIGFDILVVRSTKVSAEAIAACDNLGLIVRAGAGTDNVDKPAASAKGIFVCNVPGRNAIAVAELTMALLLAVDRRIADNASELRAGTWNKSLYTKADGLYGKHFGIIGLGDIGLAVATRAKAFGMTVSAIRKDGRPPETTAAIRSVGIRMVESMDVLLAESHVISLHVPKSANTIAMVDDNFLAQLQDGAILLNTSRGEVVDELALLKALDSGRLRAGLDVWANEPSSGQGTFESPVAVHPAVVGSHHIGASTSQAQRSVADGTVETIKAYTDGEPINCVNMQVEKSGAAALKIRHLDRVGVLAKIFAILRAAGLNVQQVQNQVFTGGEAAVASINVSEAPTADVLDALNQLHEVLSVVVASQD